MTKFKKGDKVRVICNDEFVPKGTVLTIKRGPVGYASGGNYCFEERRGIILGNDLELVTEASELTTKFNVGDVVVTLAKCGWAKSGQGVMLAGAIGKVKSVEGDLLTIKFNKKQPTPNATKEDRKNFVVRTSEVRLATAEEAATITKKKKKAEVITSDETLSFEGEQYRKVDRYANEGDVVIFSATPKFNGQGSYITVGKPYKVSDGNGYDDALFYADDSDHIRVYGEIVNRNEKNVAVYEPVEKAESSYVPQEGDIVVVTANNTGSANNVGDIRRVGAEKPLRDGGVCVYAPKGPTSSVRTWPSDIRKATPAEIAQYEQALADASEPEVKTPVLKAGDYVKFTENQIGIIGGDLYEIIERYEVIGLIDKDGDFRHGGVFGDEYEIIPADDAKWAKVGREPGEYKAGDIVRIVKEGSSGFVKGTLGVVDEDCNDGDDCPRVTAYAADEGEVATYWEKVELVAPVESTLN